MSKLHPMKEIVESRRMGTPKGIYSACSANAYVIEACMEKAQAAGESVLIEATANQVNQFGGYTGMKPADFSRFVYDIADKIGFPHERIILGGDHLGPLTWKSETSQNAMEKSIELIREYVLAGFTKIHLDTSMHLADDDTGKKLDTSVIAERGAVLCKAAETAFKEIMSLSDELQTPVYIVGSEVPIPGGSQKEGEGIQVTSVRDFEETVETYKDTFFRFGLQSAWENVIAVVVQPGVEFGDETVHEYNRKAAAELCETLKKYPNLVFEGHSTDYQTPGALKEMVEDGIAILKVGPALTFALREALFALNNMENELFKYDPGIQLSNLIETLDTVMARNPDNWKKHYHGNPATIRYARKFSYSDRVRYYLPLPEVRESIELMIQNLKTVEIPLTLIDQYLPLQYARIRSGKLKNDPEAMIKDRIGNYIDDYIYAITPKKSKTKGRYTYVERNTLNFTS
ncbi:MAG TPA: class II D-tagatose-bisphosphate aldolase, non-catalytic subunit [Clostridia bacterium]|nr:class II D-tagatose-bisphosphate aldolase, non-catalytic subunit [Clostridia bacterium]